jgi:putative membrane protein
MIFSLLLPLLLGLLAGIITGLTPGIHINLVSLLLVGSAPFLLGHFSLMGLAVFIIAMSVVHTFLDSLPSIFLGAPDAATALGVLPGHRYLLQGWGMMAVKLTIIGSLGAAMLSVFFFPLFVWVVEWSYPLFSSIMGWLLLAVAIFYGGARQEAPLGSVDLPPFWKLGGYCLEHGDLGEPLISDAFGLIRDIHFAH